MRNTSLMRSITHGNDSDAIDVDADATSSLRDPSEQQWFKDAHLISCPHARKRPKNGQGLENQENQQATSSMMVKIRTTMLSTPRKKPDDGQLEGSGDNFIEGD
ncbi:hypothetical protein B0H14DRAFT_2640825 [Mycena olivaceomarginata]|nr:hypothetical protein B0H14DRAFT_2640825 [Mycena olivaceomarginata]